ncbi:hypothetical protein Pcinc_003179 [Petrolisthes cinctipes]|uniref:Uncharacterized protein n=1 Tax=Petrolisthes cinctipes TaxID=88211 RepID=A0AAE1GJE8_PETCI|nr:hypothetical protein Pcinc_003179 [Petrolisthes cinctipes]
MAGSGIEDLWETVYARNSVVHMMTVRAYARSLRAHFLTERALAGLLLESYLDNDALKTDLEICYMSLIQNTSTIEAAVNSSVVKDIQNQLELNLDDAESRGRTEKFNQSINHFL